MRLPGCGKLAVAQGLCQSHRKQRKKGQPLRPLRPFYGTKGPCRFDGCEKPRVSGGYCAGHAAQYYSGRTLTPLFRPRVGCDFSWLYEAPFRTRLLSRSLAAIARESSARTSSREARVADGPRLHRRIRAHASECKERRRNGVRDDNRPENLELWARGMQPPGSRVSDLIDSAVRVLRLYRPDLLSTSANSYDILE